MSREDELKSRIASDSGDPAFAELSDLYMAEGRVGEALTTLLAGLSANPDFHIGRLVLARLFVHLGYTPFAIRELQTLHRQRPDCDSVRRLLEAISPGSSRESWTSTKPDNTISSDSEAGSSPPGQGQVEGGPHGDVSAHGPAAVSGATAEEETIAEGEFDFDVLADFEADLPQKE